MEITNEEIYEKLLENSRMLEVLVSYRRTDKARALENEVRLRKVLTVNKIQTFLGGISRPWALRLMKRLGEQEHFSFILGDKILKKPSLIVYEEAKEKREFLKKLKFFVDQEGVVSLAQIADPFDLTVEDNLINIRKILRDFIELESTEESEYYVKDGNKLCKKI